MADWHLTNTGDATWQAIHSSAPIIVNTGGARSGKSFGIMQCLITLASRQKDLRISCVSRSLPHVKKGIFRDFQTLYKDGLFLKGEMRWTDFTFHFYNGSYIEFFGLEDPDKAHGPGRDVLFINEANFVPKTVFDQLAMRTTGKILLDLNPSEFNSWVYDVADNPANINIHSTYLDNIANLSASQIAYIESYKALPDPFLWQVYGLGQRGASEDIIIRHYQLCDEMPGKGERVYGLDFGFVHPCALTEINLYEGAAYIDETIYQSGLTKPELTEKMKAIDLGSDYIYADSSEADSIEELYRNGFNIHSANKDVWNGILTLKSLPLFITRRSKNIIREIQSYRWKKDKNDRILEEPLKENDDAMDSIRYAVHTHFSKPKLTFEIWQ